MEWKLTVGLPFFQDTKPHRQFAFSDILDALECDLPFVKQNSASPSIASSPQSGTEADDVNAAHTFKIVTTKRALLLCAPSEEDEIKWLGAIRALIVRRSESGQVPGKTPKHRVPENSKDIEESTAAANSGGSGGLKNKVRRLSGAGYHDEAKG